MNKHFLLKFTEIVRKKKRLSTIWKIWNDNFPDENLNALVYRFFISTDDFCVTHNLVDVLGVVGRALKVRVLYFRNIFFVSTRGKVNKIFCLYDKNCEDCQVWLKSAAQSISNWTDRGANSTSDSEIVLTYIFTYFFFQFFIRMKYYYFSFSMFLWYSKWVIEIWSHLNSFPYIDAT